MRDYALVYVNGVRHEVKGEWALATLSDYLRYKLQLTGTKIVCSEGDCGACTVVRAFPSQNKAEFESINSCICSVAQMDCSALVTIEGMKENINIEADVENLHPIQKAMLKCHGSQCGFCTPGFVMAMAPKFEKQEKASAIEIKNCLTGNLCRCTGYLPIVEAGKTVQVPENLRLKKRYLASNVVKDLEEHQKIPLQIETKTKKFHAPTQLNMALQIKNSQPDLRTVSSSTDLGVQINKGHLRIEHSLNLNLIRELHEIKESNGRVHVGARASLSNLRKFVKKQVPALAEMLNIFASPQIKNVATLIGNIANGSPIADSLPFLYVCEAELTLASSDGERIVPIADFYLAYKKFALKENELIRSVSFVIPHKTETLRLYKVSQRRDLDISAVTAAYRLQLSKNKIQSAQIAYGGVGPVIIELKDTAKFLKGRTLDKESVRLAAEKIRAEISPISDVRGTEDFRLQIAENLIHKFYHEHNEVTH